MAMHRHWHPDGDRDQGLGRRGRIVVQGTAVCRGRDGIDENDWDACWPDQAACDADQ